MTEQLGRDIATVVATQYGKFLACNEKRIAAGLVPLTAQEFIIELFKFVDEKKESSEDARS